jgi:serine/threonine protein kinase
VQLIGGRYRVERELGSGGMGTVYLCRDEQTSNPAAVKLMHPQFVQRKDYVARFKRESEIACRLNHPNIVRGLAFGTEGGVPYLAMDVLSGRSLGELLFEDGRRFDAPTALAIIGQAAEGLSALVATGKVIAHRDLSSANIFLQSDGTVKIGDFGIAKVDDSGETRTGLFLGNVRYMSPEQITDPKRLDVRSDIYMLGVVLYELVTGQHLFEGSPHEIANQHLYSTPPVPPLNGPGAEACLSVLRRCLAKSPDDRFAAPQEMVRAIRESGFEADGSIAVKMLPQRGRLSPALAVALAVLSLFVLIGWVAQSAKTGVANVSPPPVTSPSTSSTALTVATSSPDSLEISPATIGDKTNAMTLKGRGPTNARYAVLHLRAGSVVFDHTFAPGDTGWSDGVLGTTLNLPGGYLGGKLATLSLTFFESDPKKGSLPLGGPVQAQAIVTRRPGTRPAASGSFSVGGGGNAGAVVY